MEGILLTKMEAFKILKIFEAEQGERYSGFWCKRCENLFNTTEAKKLCHKSCYFFLDTSKDGVFYNPTPKEIEILER